MSSNVIELFGAPRWRVLVAHHNGDVRHALRTLIEASDIIVEQVTDCEAALEVLEVSRFDLLVLELDLPVHDGVTVMQLHRVLLAHERVRVEPPAVIFTLAPRSVQERYANRSSAFTGHGGVHRRRSAERRGEHCRCGLSGARSKNLAPAPSYDALSRLAPA